MRSIQSTVFAIILFTFVITCCRDMVLATKQPLYQALHDIEPFIFGEAHAASKENGLTYAFHGYPYDNCTVMHKALCVGPSKDQRLGCCKPSSPMKAIYNTMIENGRIVAYVGPDDALPPSSNRESVWSVPSVHSVQKKKMHDFNMKVDIRKSYFCSDCCKRYINGTLHVIGKQTVNNLFHTMNDNVLPLLSQVILDAHYFPELLLSPRVLLSGVGPAATDTMLHMRLIQDMMTETMTVAQANGVCFRRILWSEGPRLIYNQALALLRRQTADLARAFVIRRYDPPIPTEFQLVKRQTGSSVLLSSPEQSRAKFLQSAGRANTRSVAGRGRGISAPASPVKENINKDTTPNSPEPKVPPEERNNRPPPTVFVVDGRPLNILIITRGDSGRGRTIRGEKDLRDSLIADGANAVLCCDFKSTSFEKQLAYAVHADVIIGLHGAGLMNIVFARRGAIMIELKTTYAYALNLFTIATEARAGIHAQIDIRGYSETGGHRPIDGALISRIKTAISKATELQSKSHTAATTSATDNVNANANSNGNDNVDAVTNGTIRTESGTSFHHTGTIPDAKYLPISSGENSPTMFFPLGTGHSGDMLTRVDQDYSSDDELGHILGPKRDAVVRVCKQMSFEEQKRRIGAEDNLHCLPCT